MRSTDPGVYPIGLNSELQSLAQCKAVPPSVFLYLTTFFNRFLNGGGIKILRSFTVKINRLV